MDEPSIGSKNLSEPKHLEHPICSISPRHPAEAQLHYEEEPNAAPANTNTKRTMRLRRAIHRTTIRCVNVLQAPTFVGVAFVLLLLAFALPKATSSGIDADRIVSASNEVRARVGASTLLQNPILTASARRRAEELLRNNLFGHVRPDGTSFSSAADEYGYSYAVLGENLALHFTDERSVIAAWERSPGHARNLLNPSAVETGVGIVSGMFNGAPTMLVVLLVAVPARPDATAADRTMSALHVA